MRRPQRNALQAVLDRQGAPTAADEVRPPSPAPSGGGPGVRAPSRAPSRQGKRLIGGHFPPGVAKQLKILAAEEGKSVQVLLEEALDLLFVKKGRDRIGGV